MDGLSHFSVAERFRKFISHLIAHLHICGYHNRLYTLDTQIEHTGQQSLFCLGEWINWWYRYSILKCAGAEEELGNTNAAPPSYVILARSGCSLTHRVLGQAKNPGKKAVNTVILLRSSIKMRETQVEELCRKFLEAVMEESEDAGLHEAEYKASKEALAKSQTQLKTMAKSEYMCLRMNAHTLKLCLWERLHARKFELDVVERLYRQLVNDAKLHAHTELVVKRQEPAISKLAANYNKLCTQINNLIRNKKAPCKAVAPIPIPCEGLWQLDVDDTIFQDVGLDDHDDYQDGPPLWLCNKKVCAGIKALLELDRCDKEDAQLQRENMALRVWFAEEWQIIKVAVEAASGVEKHHFQLHQDKLVQLCATWDRCLPDFGPVMGQLPE
ncbi:hypothetical protein C8R45DRAFT_817825 [Mycena sanguinolenta]|nr:hypothetical protein C8R45DRAFT_817825 [Mycena sanguinolenta]